VQFNQKSAVLRCGAYSEPWTGTDHRFGVARAEVEALSLQKNSLKELQEYYRKVVAVA